MSAVEKKVVLLPVKDILPSENPREDFDPIALAELMQSMKHSGLLSPVGVRILPTGRYKLVFGARRLLAATRLGWGEIETIIVDVSDEKDALIKTSTENVIRENVSLPEQGRIFTTLLKKGMTSDQIAVRMGCSKVFVMNATQAFNEIPRRFHNKITYGTRGQTNKPGMIPATVALAATDIKKRNKLTQEQIGKLMDWAAKNGVNVVKMRTAGSMIASGVEPKKAMDQVEFMKTISFTVNMKIKTIHKLQVKYGMSIHNIIYKYLEANKELEAIPGRDSMLTEETPREFVSKRKVPGRNK